MTKNTIIFRINRNSTIAPAFLLMMVIASSLPVPAQTSPAKPVVHHYDLPTTIAAALQSSSDLKTAQRNVEIDLKRSDRAAATGRPSASANASATRYDAPTKISFGSGPPVEIQKDHSEILAINLGERLDLTGQIRAASSQERLQSLADQFVVDQIRNARILRAKTIYFNLLRAQHQVQVGQAELDTALAQQKTATALNAEQVGQKIDVLRANTQAANARQYLNRAQNNLGIALANFNNLIGQPYTNDVTVDDVPGATVGVSVVNTNTVGAPAANITLFTVPPADTANIDLKSSLATAETQRPEILAQEVNVRVAETGIKLARAGLEPNLSINASGNYYPTTSFQFPRQRTAAVTLDLAIPLWDGGATRDRIAEARLLTENARTILDSRRSDVSLDVNQAYLNLMTAADQVNAANTALQQAIAARQLAQIRYEGQVGLYLEVSDAQAALTTAENNQVNTVYDYLVARAQFQNALGAPELK